MGQYHKLVNLDKKEFINPHKMGSGLKLDEFNESLVMVALSILLSDNNGQGCGDIFKKGRGGPADHSGRWAGNRIVITGDYTAHGTHKEERDGDNLYGSLYEEEAEDGTKKPTDFTDISGLMRESLLNTDWYAEQMAAAKDWTV